MERASSLEFAVSPAHLKADTKRALQPVLAGVWHNVSADMFAPVSPVPSVLDPAVQSHALHNSVLLRQLRLSYCCR